MPKRLTGVYLIRHKASGNSYVGQALSISSRWTQHRKLLSAGKHHSPKLQGLWTRDGAHAFDFVVVEEVPFGETELEVQRWLIGRERAEYNKLKDIDRLLNATLPAIVATNKAKEQYAKETKQKEKVHDREIAHERVQRQQELQSVLAALHPIDLQYEQYKRDLNVAQNELSSNSGFFATLLGRASKFDHNGCKRQVASLQMKIIQIEPQILVLRAKAQEITQTLKLLHNSYSGVRERRIKRILAHRAIPYKKRTVG